MPSPRNRSKRQSCPSHLWQLSCWLILSGPQTFSHEAATTTIHNALYRQRKTKRKVWKAGSTSKKTYFWGQDHVFFHSFQHVLHVAYKQLNNHHLICSTHLQMWHSLTAISLPLGWLFLPSPRLWLLSRPPRCQIPWPFWGLWQPAPGTLLSMHSTFAAGRQMVMFDDFCMFLSALTRNKARARLFRRPKHRRKKQNINPNCLLEHNGKYLYT